MPIFAKIFFHISVHKKNAVQIRRIPKIYSVSDLIFYEILFCFIHCFVIFLIVTTGNIFHPVFMLKEPLDCQTDTIFETGFRIPANFLFDLVRCDRITTVMSLTIFYICDQVLTDKFFTRIPFRSISCRVSRMIWMI